MQTRRSIVLNYKSDIDLELVQKMGGDHMVVAAARVSTSGDECLKYVEPECNDENFGLINYLMKHRHGTPFEHAAMTFYVRAPIFVWREWHRHRIGFGYNEESGRYTKLEPTFYIPSLERAMSKVEKWRAGRPKFAETPTDVNLQVVENLKKSYELSYQMYEANLDLGIDPGVARSCLPVGIYSRCWVTCNPRSLMAFLSLRTYEPDRAQFVSYPLKEIEFAARAAEEFFAKGWPLTYKAFCENGRVGP